MINLKDGELADVSPFKGDPKNDAFSYAIKKMMQFILEKADGTRTYSIIQNLPDDILDMLAVELRTMYYEETMDISVKRNIIQNTLSWYAKAGTPAAVEELISVVFGSGKIVEWFDFTEPPYTPGTFDIITNAPMERGIIDTLSAIIDKVKNARSQIRRVVINRDLHQGASIAMRSVAVTETVVLNYEHYANEAALNNYYAASQNATTETFVINSDESEFRCKIWKLRKPDCNQSWRCNYCSEQQRDTGYYRKTRNSRCTTSCNSVKYDDSSER